VDFYVRFKSCGNNGVVTRNSCQVKDELVIGANLAQ
jgi:hypothetical protein